MEFSKEVREFEAKVFRVQEELRLLAKMGEDFPRQIKLGNAQHFERAGHGAQRDGLEAIYPAAEALSHWAQEGDHYTIPREAYGLFRRLATEEPWFVQAYEAWVAEAEDDRRAFLEPWELEEGYLALISNRRAVRKGLVQAVGSLAPDVLEYADPRDADRLAGGSEDQWLVLTGYKTLEAWDGLHGAKKRKRRFLSAPHWGSFGQFWLEGEGVARCDIPSRNVWPLEWPHVVAMMANAHRRGDYGELVRMDLEELARAELPNDAPTWSVARLKRELKERRLEKLCAAGPVSPWATPAHVHQLITAGDLVREGEEMSHCVGSYIDSLLNGEAFYYHIDLEGSSSGATLKVSPEGEALEVRGRANRDLTDQEVVVATSWLEEAVGAVKIAPQLDGAWAANAMLPLLARGR